MAVNPMLASGADGIANGLKGFEGVAQEIAEFNGTEVGASGEPRARLDNPADVAEALVDLKVYARQVQASAKVVQTADEVIGFLLGTSASG